MTRPLSRNGEPPIIQVLGALFRLTDLLAVMQCAQVRAPHELPGRSLIGYDTAPQARNT